MMSNDDEDDELLQFVGGGRLQQESSPSTGHDSADLLHNMVGDEQSPDDNDDRDALLGGEGEGDRERSGKYNFWSLEFYSQWFDVDESDVRERILAGMTPRPSRPFLGHAVKKSRADLYGPFWVCATLVVAIAVSGNLAAYLQSPPSEGVGGGLRWHYDFHKVTLAT